MVIGRQLPAFRLRNPALYYFGCIYFIGGLPAFVMTQASDTIVLGINAWIKCHCLNNQRDSAQPPSQTWHRILSYIYFHNLLYT